jgi:hypothetical protein
MELLEISAGKFGKFTRAAKGILEIERKNQMGHSW